MRRPRRLTTLAFALALPSPLAACEPRPEPAPAALAIEVVAAGCAARRTAGPGIAGCELPLGGELRLWVETRDGAELSVEADGAPLAERATPMPGGTLLRVTVPAGARALSVRAVAAGARGAWELPFLPSTLPPAMKELDELRRAGRFDESSRGLAPFEASADDGVRAQAVGRRGRIHLAQGQSAEAVASFRKALVLDAKTGRLSNASEDSYALGYALAYRGRHFAESRAVLEPLYARSKELPGAWTGTPYYLALIAKETGDTREALRLLEESEQRSRRLGDDVQRLDALEVEADVLQLLGRTEEGEARLREVRDALPAGTSPCREAVLLLDIGVFAHQLERAEHRRLGWVESPVAPLEQAVEVFRSRCPRPSDQCNTLTELAETLLDEGSPALALRTVEEARAVQASPDDLRLPAVWMDIEGRTALAEGRAEGALAAYERLGQLADRALLPTERWKAALGRARALEALGRLDLARDAYAGAERLIDELSLAVPLGEGREGFLHGFEESARERVEFLLRHDGPGAAVEAARRSRARALASLRWADRVGTLAPAARGRWDEALATYRREREALADEARGEWQLPGKSLADASAAWADRARQAQAALEAALAVLGRGELDASRSRPLAAPGEGEAFLVYHPLRRGWVGFAVTRAGVTAEELPELDLGASPAELSTRLLEPFRRALEGSRRLRILPFGALERVDFHALPWNGRPLLASFPVAYGVDLGVAPQPDEEDGTGTAVVVADPRGDLRAARREAAATATALAGRGFLVDLLQAGETTESAVRARLELPDVRVLHYSGHGLAAGRDGWGSGLPLAGSEWLTVPDVLSLARAPAEVVLSSCSAARVAEASHPEGLGIAQAFLLAGSAVVVAATRDVDDELAAALMEAFVAEPAGRPSEVVLALRDAELALQARSPRADWASFRVLLP